MNGIDDERRESPVPGTDPPPTPTNDEPAPRRRLYREPEEKKLTGVCGGLADYTGADPTIVRLSVVLLVLSIGIPAVVGYVVAAFVMPERPTTVPRVQAAQPVVPSSLTPHVWFALLIAAVVLLGFEDRWWFDAPVIGVALVGLGVWFLLHRDHAGGAPTVGAATGAEENHIFRENVTAGSDESTTLLPEVAPERAHAGPPASEDRSGTALDKTEDESQPVPVPPEPSSSVPDHSAHRAGPQGEVPPPVPPWGLGTSPVPDPVSSSPDRRGTLAFFGLLLVVGGVGALLAVVDVVDVTVGTALASTLVALGLGLVVGAWRGQSRALIGVGLPIVGLLVLGDAADFPMDAGTDDADVVVDERAELDDEYELLAGQLRLDLRRMDEISLDEELPVLDAEVFVGELVVLVPDDIPVEIDALTSIGEIRGPDGRQDGGIHAERHFVVGDTGQGDPELRLDLKMGLGEIEVRRG